MRRALAVAFASACVAASALASVTVVPWKPAGASRYILFCVADLLSDLPTSSIPNGVQCHVLGDGNYFYESGVWTLVSGGGGGGAPTTVDYLVKTADSGLSAERAVTDTATVTWDWGTSGQARATAVDLTCTDCLTATEIDESTLPASGLTQPQIMARLAVGGGF